MLAVSLGHNSFSASNGWLEVWQKRFSVRLATLCGEAAEVPEDVMSLPRAATCHDRTHLLWPSGVRLWQVLLYIAKDAASGTQRSEIVSSTRVLYEP